MPNEPYGWTIFCDDIRQEVGNKTSLIGVYAGDLQVHGAFPATLAKFGLSISYRIHLDDHRMDDVALGIFLPGDDDAPSIKAVIPLSQLIKKADPPTRSGDTFREFHANLIMTPLKLKEPGIIRVRANGGAGEVKLGSLRVEAGTASAPGVNPAST